MGQAHGGEFDPGLAHGRVGDAVVEGAQADEAGRHQGTEIVAQGLLDGGRLAVHPHQGGLAFDHLLDLGETRPGQGHQQHADGGRDEDLDEGEGAALTAHSRLRRMVAWAVESSLPVAPAKTRTWTWARTTLLSAASIATGSSTRSTK